MSLEEAEQTSDQVLLADSSGPRFGIMDMMVLTAAMALVFALRDQFDAAGWKYRTDVSWFKVIEHVTFCLSYGLPTAAVFRFLIHKRKSGRFLFEPGHWILLAAFLVSAGTACSMLTLFSLGWIQNGGIEGPTALWFFIPLACFSILSGCILIRGAFAVRGWWQHVLVLLVLTDFFGALQNLMYALLISSSATTGWSWISYIGWGSAVINGLTCIGLLIVVTKEILRGPSRDVWHWIGALIPFLGCLVYPLLNWIYSIYLFQAP